MIAPWPESRDEEGWEENKIKEFELIQEIIRTIRNLRAEKNIKPGKLVPAKLVAGEYMTTLQDEIGSITSLAFLDPGNTQVLSELDKVSPDDIALVAGPVEIYLPLSGLIDLKEEEKRLTAELEEITQEIKRLEALLASPFAQKAPSQVVDKEREKLAGYMETAETLEVQLSNIQGLS
jgi:valyl-tRNA synthetase